MQPLISSVPVVGVRVDGDKKNEKTDESSETLGKRKAIEGATAYPEVDLAEQAQKVNTII